MKIVTTSKLGLNRGTARLWLEGKKLEDGGFLPGTQFNVQIGEDRLEIQADPQGKYKISSRTRNGRTAPILDLNFAALGEVFEADSKLRVEIEDGRIEVTIHVSDEQVEQRETELKRKVAAGETLKVCSLFHGGGVMDKAIHEGFKENGISLALAAAVEIEPAYLDSSLRNNPELWATGSVAYESRIEDVCPSLNQIKADILVAGIPCTGASKSGRTKNKLDCAEAHPDAGAMFYHFLKFVEFVNPAMIVIENVPEYANTASMEVIRAVLGALRYNLEECVFDSSEFGVIEKRRRLCLLAVSQGLDLTNVLASVKAANANANATPINNILEDLDSEDPAWKTFDYLAEKEVRDIAAGKGFKRQLLTGTETQCGTIGKDYAKCRSTEPFIKHPTDPSRSRIFTPTEHARLKGAPVALIQGLSNTIAHQILGQSVVYTVFKNVGAALAASLNKFKVA